MLMPAGIDLRMRISKDADFPRPTQGKWVSASFWKEVRGAPGPAEASGPTTIDPLPDSGRPTYGWIRRASWPASARRSKTRRGRSRPPATSKGSSRSRTRAKVIAKNRATRTIRSGTSARSRRGARLSHPTRGIRPRPWRLIRSRWLWARGRAEFAARPLQRDVIGHGLAGPTGVRPFDDRDAPRRQRYPVGLARAVSDFHHTASRCSRPNAERTL